MEDKCVMRNLEKLKDKIIFLQLHVTHIMLVYRSTCQILVYRVGHENLVLPYLRSQKIFKVKWYIERPRHSFSLINVLPQSHLWLCMLLL